MKRHLVGQYIIQFLQKKMELDADRSQCYLYTYYTITHTYMYMYLSDNLLLAYTRRELWYTSSSPVCISRTSLQETDIIVFFGAKITD